MGARVICTSGSQKSGTTYLQHACADRLDELAAAGLRYPVEPSGRNEVPNHQLAFYGLHPAGVQLAGRARLLRVVGLAAGASWRRTSSPRAAVRGGAVHAAPARRGHGGRGASAATSRSWSPHAPRQAARLLVAAERAQRARRRVPRVPRVRARPSGPAAGRHRRRGAGPDLAVVLGRRADPALVRPAPGCHGSRSSSTPVAAAALLWQRILEALDLPHRTPSRRPHVASGQTNEGLRWAETDILAALNRALTGPGWDRNAGDRRPQGGDQRTASATATRTAARRTLPAGVAGRGRAVGQRGRARRSRTSGRRVVGPLADLLPGPAPRRSRTSWT